MYTRISESGGRRYLQLVEGHRDELGKVRIKVVANLGRLDRLSPGKLDPRINSLNRAVGRLENTASDIAYESSLAYVDVFALHELWKDLGFDRGHDRATLANRAMLYANARAKNPERWSGKTRNCNLPDQSGLTLKPKPAPLKSETPHEIAGQLL